MKNAQTQIFKELDLQLKRIKKFKKHFFLCLDFEVHFVHRLVKVSQIFDGNNNIVSHLHS
jgi:hypothetical protein